MSAKDVVLGGVVVVVALAVIGAMNGGGKKHHDSPPTDTSSSFVLDTSVPSDDGLPSDDAGTATSTLNMPCSTYVSLSGSDRLTEADAYLANYGDGSHATIANARDVRSIFDTICKSYPDENTDDAFDLAKMGLS